MRTVSSVVFAGAAVLFLMGTVRSAPISGQLWSVPEAVVDSPTGATPGNIPGTPPDVTFDVNAPLNFNPGIDSPTVAQWLASGGAFNIVGPTGGFMDDLTNGTLVEFTGLVTVTTGQMFTVTHDDGLTLIIGGVDLGFDPGPTPPITSTATYGGPSGTFAFQLVYSECCDGPAVLQIDLPFQPGTVPEPMTISLMVAGIAACGALYRRRARKS